MTTHLHEPPLTEAFVVEHVRVLREAYRDALREVAKLSLVPERHGRMMEEVDRHQGRSDTLRTLVVYMLAWHRVEGDPVMMARALSTLAELLPTEPTDE